ncbi:MAG: pseudouridine synthase [Candidatus Omnitrophota bacterium]
MRLDSLLAKAGVCSRRRSKELVKQGMVEVNNSIVTEPGLGVNPASDKIFANGKPIRLSRDKIYIMLNKPRGTVTTVSDPHHRKTVMDLLPKNLKRVYPVGRLDRDTSGLLILTNDGELTNRLTHPRFNIDKVYEARIKGDLIDKDRQTLQKGIRIDNKKTAPCRISVLHKSKEHTIAQIRIHEGRKRQIRLMFGFLGYPVARLKRVKLGSLKLGSLEPGEFRFLSQKEVDSLWR